MAASQRTRCLSSRKGRKIVFSMGMQDRSIWWKGIHRKLQTEKSHDETGNEHIQSTTHHFPHLGGRERISAELRKKKVRNSGKNNRSQEPSALIVKWVLWKAAQACSLLLRTLAERLTHSLLGKFLARCSNVLYNHSARLSAQSNTSKTPKAVAASSRL